MEITPCGRCGHPISSTDLACPACGALVHGEQLSRLAAEAMRQESIDPTVATALWNQCLALLPPGCGQDQMVRGRLAALAQNGSPVLNYAPPSLRLRPLPRPPKPDTLSTALLKTGGSMLLSIVVYYFLVRSDMGPAAWWFAIGFTVLILVHEMGHVVAMRYYHLNASVPIFIPLMGAIINLRQNPPNAKVEAIVGIGGPVAGAAGSLACLAVAAAISPLHHGSAVLLLLELAWWGCFMNLFNLLPVPPLDGGRVTAAVSPKIWMLGLIAMGGLMVWDMKQSGEINPIMLLVLIMALPRIVQTLRRGGHLGDYYRISRRATWTIGTLYLSLCLLLAGAMVVNQRLQSAATAGQTPTAPQEDPSPPAAGQPNV